MYYFNTKFGVGLETRVGTGMTFWHPGRRGGGPGGTIGAHRQLPESQYRDTATQCTNGLKLLSFGSTYWSNFCVPGRHRNDFLAPGRRGGGWWGTFGAHRPLPESQYRDTATLCTNGSSFWCHKRFCTNITKTRFVISNFKKV